MVLKHEVKGRFTYFQHQTVNRRQKGPGVDSGLCLYQIMKRPERLALRLDLYPVGTKRPVLGNERTYSDFQVGISISQLQGEGVNMGSRISPYKSRGITGLQSKPGSTWVCSSPA